METNLFLILAFFLLLVFWSRSCYFRSDEKLRVCARRLHTRTERDSHVPPHSQIVSSSRAYGLPPGAGGWNMPYPAAASAAAAAACCIAACCCWVGPGPPRPLPPGPPTGPLPPGPGPGKAPLEGGAPYPAIGPPMKPGIGVP